MILGIGTDLANIERIQRALDRFGDRFRNRVFTEHEQKRAERMQTPLRFTPKDGPPKRPVPRHWERGCAWGLRGAICR